MQVVFENLAKGSVKCPKCNHSKLTSKGWRPGLHRVLTLEGQFYILSFGFECPKCPEHVGKDGLKGE